MSKHVKAGCRLNTQRVTKHYLSRRLQTFLSIETPTLSVWSKGSRWTLALYKGWLGRFWQTRLRTAANKRLLSFVVDEKSLPTYYSPPRDYFVLTIIRWKDVGQLITSDDLRFVERFVSSIIWSHNSRNPRSFREFKLSQKDKMKKYIRIPINGSV